jgi:CheY-like chemotaxis protein
MASPQNFASELTALVVDDKKSYQKIHQMMLNNFGVKSHVVENGKEAVDIHLHGKKFDLILMDMDMPIMNGIEVYICLINYITPQVSIYISSTSKKYNYVLYIHYWKKIINDKRFKKNSL